MDTSKVIEGNKPQTVEQLVYQNRLVSLDASPNNEHVAYCVKEFNQSTKSSAVNVFTHSAGTMRSVRMTGNTTGASVSAAIVSDIVGTEDMVCFLQNGAVMCMALTGGCQSTLAGGEEDRQIQGFKIFTGPFNRIWMVAVLDVPVRPPAAKTPAQTSGMVFDALMIRHWTEWNAYAKRNHLLLFELSVTPEGLLALKEGVTPTDIMQNLETDCPGKGPGDGDEDFCVSPEGTYIAMAFRRPAPADDAAVAAAAAAGSPPLQGQARDLAWSTDTGIYVSKMSMDDKLSGAASAPKLISGDVRCSNKCPMFSPNGRYIAYLAMDRPGYESDKQSIKIYDIVTEVTHLLTMEEGNKVIDLSFGSICWSPDSNSIYSTAVHRGCNRIFRLSLSLDSVCSSMEEAASGKPIVVTSLATMHGNKSYAEPRIVEIAGSQYLYYLQSSFSSPNELMRLQLSSPTIESVGATVFAPLAEYDVAAFKDITDCLDPYQGQLRAQYIHSPCPEYGNGDIAAPTITEHYFTGANGDIVHAYYLRPISTSGPDGADPASLGDASVPLLLIVHGGPQGAIMNAWNFRWNLSIFAAQGYGVLAVNFHGSVGYGQEFTDSIRGDWGNGPYQDCLLGVDYILREHRYLDTTRVAGLGASYGGYMMNWMNGHTDRFKCLVNHDGIFSLRALFYVTEELWFPGKILCLLNCIYNA
jgi:dipeptidyl aminopeptidase/acylaminoacyl peptidase